MLEPVLFTSIDDIVIPCTGLFCSRFGRFILPGTHITFICENTGQQCVGRIISCHDHINAVINVYEYYDEWHVGRSKPKLTNSWSRGLHELVITDIKVPIKSSAVQDIAFVFLEEVLKNYKYHGPLHGIDNVYIVRYKSDGESLDSFISFTRDFLVTGRPTLSEIEPTLLSSTHAMMTDYCKEVYNGITQIQYSISNSLNRQSARQGNEGSITRKVFLSEIVFQYVAMKTGKTISDCNNKKRQKFDAFLLTTMDYIKRTRSYNYTGISFITDDDIKKFICVFGYCSIIGIRKSRPKKSETFVLQHNDLLNIIFPPELTPRDDGSGIQLLYSSGINELTIEADFSCHIYHPPRFETDLMHKKRSEWWFTVKMVPTILLDVLPAAFEAIHIAGTTTSPDVKVGLLFQINNTPY